GKLDEAKLVICRLGGPSFASQKDVDQQLQELSRAIVGEKDSKFCDLLSASNIKSLAIACTLQLAKQSSGFTALQYFSAYIFGIIGFSDSHSSNIPMITLAVFQTLSVVAALGIVDTLGPYSKDRLQ
ncbi:hypothetical protein GGI12_005865, partial [Dipsacomyces acuminosporus]